MRHVVSQLLDISERSYYTFKKQGRPVIRLLETYFSKSDLEEWIQYEKISKLDILKDFEAILQGSKLDYLKFVSEELNFSLEYDLFTDLYYKLLIYLYDMQKLENTDITSVWMVGDALPGFLLESKYSNTEEDKEDEAVLYKIKDKFGIINHFDQNMSNFIRLSLTREMIPLIRNTKGTDIDFSEVYRMNAVYHVLLFNIYKKNPKLTYKEKIIKLGNVLGFNIENLSAEQIDEIFNMPNNWKIVEADIDKSLKMI